MTAPFRYHAPESAGEAADLLGSLDDVVLVAGGTMLIPALTRGAVCPANVVDLARAGLAGTRLSDGLLHIGATTTYRDLARTSVVRSSAPLLAAAAARITGGPQVRNIGTIGGSACYANPSSDMPACLVALDATLRLVRRGGEREVAASAFFLDAFRSAVRQGELLSEIAVNPFGPRDSFGYEKLKFCESSWPIVTVACVVRRDPGGAVRTVVLSVGGAARSPVRLEFRTDELADVEERVEGALVDPWSDVLASGAYRLRVAPVLARRAVATSLGSRAAT